MKFKLLYNQSCQYEVEAETEDEAITMPVPKTGHICSITIVNDYPIERTQTKPLPSVGVNWPEKKNKKLGIPEEIADAYTKDFKNGWNACHDEFMKIINGESNG